MAITPGHGGTTPPASGHGASSSFSAPPNGAFDPYFLYAESTDFRFVRGKQADFVPILLELTASLRTWLGHGQFLPDPNASFIQISPLYTEAPDPLLDTHFVTALVLSEFFKKLHEGSLKFVRRFEYCAPLDTPQSWPVKPAFELKGPTAKLADKPPVLVGVIDDAIGFAHHRFRYANGQTRLHGFWDQGAIFPVGGGVGAPGPPPSNGVIFYRSDIDSLLTQATFAGSIDEDQVYALAGQDFIGDAHKNRGRRAGHGTHVLDIAAGEEPGAVSAVTPIIAAVQLPVAVTADTSGAKLTSYALDGLWWIAMQALALGPAHGVTALPCVVNLSYGTLSGPHDGTGLFPLAADFLIAVWRNVLKQRLALVLPAGNGHLSVTHAKLELPPDASVSTLQWQILPDTRTPSFLEIWLPPDTADQEVEVRVTPPGQPAGAWIREGDPMYTWAPAQPPAPPPVLSVLSVRYSSVVSVAGPVLGSRKLALIAVHPTAEQATGDLIAPWGIWRVELRNVGGAAPRTVDAWIARNDSIGGYPIRGRQSRFHDASYVNDRYYPDTRPREVDTGLSMVLREGTFNDLGTGTHSVVVGGCRMRDLSTATYSAGGPILPPASVLPALRRGPDVQAPSDLSYVRAGVLAAGMSGARGVAMRGTSVAAPQITRWIAQSMLTGGGGTRTQVKGAAQLEEVARLPNLRPAGPYQKAPVIDRGGEGRIDSVRLPRANTRR